MTEKYLTVSEVATELRLDPVTIYRYIQKGLIKAKKFGRIYRISRIDLDHFTK